MYYTVVYLILYEERKAYIIESRLVTPLCSTAGLTILKAENGKPLVAHTSPTSH